MTESDIIRQNFLLKLHSPRQFEVLFENLPDIYFFVKNTECQFVMANKTFYEQCQVESEDEIIGKTDSDFFPKDRADAYIRDDQYVMSTGNSIINQVELGPEPDGSINWFVVTKVPLFSQDGEIIGIAGVARDMRKANHTLRPYNEMASVIEFINTNYSFPITTKKLAGIAHLSVSHFERRFKQVFQISPAKYIQKTRIKSACTFLSTTNDTISSIAQNCGFYDHAHFTKQFIKDVHMTPKEYRKNH